MNLELLNNKIKESGYKIGFICDKLSITRGTLRRKLSGESDFKVPEIFVLKMLLGLTEEECVDIFSFKC